MYAIRSYYGAVGDAGAPGRSRGGGDTGAVIVASSAGALAVAVARSAPGVVAAGYVD